MTDLFTKLTDWIKTVPDFLVALLILVIGILLIRLLLRVCEKAMERTKLDISLRKFFFKTIKIVCYIILIICTLSTAGVSTTGLIAGFSAAGAAVALALKDSLANIAGGIILLFSRPFVTGDYIKSGEYEGTVRRIDILQTTLVTLDNKVVVFPNGKLSSSEVINFTKEPFRRVDIEIPISYDNDENAAKEAVLNAVADEPLVLDTPDKPFVRITQYAESSIVLTARLWCKTENYWDVRLNMLESIKKQFAKSGITIPYNQLDVHISKE